MQTLRLGSKGDDVEKWQHFLRGIELYLGEVNGTFDEETKLATQAFQRQHGLLDDGIAGNRTLGEAMRVGFSVIEDDVGSEDSVEWPPPPGFPTLGQAGREAAFGRYAFEPRPIPGNPEAIHILGAWQQDNIVKVTIPQLGKVQGAPAGGQVFFHRLVAERVRLLFQRWEEAGLLPLILSYGGSFVPRFIRGSRSVLSAHSHGSAFDINVAWNGFGVIPPRVGARGSVRKLVPIANEVGFYWGGHFKKRDGMHFELARL